MRKSDSMGPHTACHLLPTDFFRGLKMTNCVPLKKEMLNDPIEIIKKDETLDFPAAKRIADQKAGEIAKDPMLLGWYDRKRARFSPNVT